MKTRNVFKNRVMNLFADKFHQKMRFSNFLCPFCHRRPNIQSKFGSFGPIHRSSGFSDFDSEWIGLLDFMVDQRKKDHYCQDCLK